MFASNVLGSLYNLHFHQDEKRLHLPYVRPQSRRLTECIEPVSSDRKRAFALTTEENMVLFLRYQDTLRAKDPDDLKVVLAPDFVDHNLPPGLPPGPEGLILYRTKVN